MPCLLSKGEEAVLPDRLDPGRLVEMQIFESITLGEGEKENTVYDPIISI
jgi:hypothetical protein